MLPMLALGALSFGGSLLQGIGAKQASAKQARLQMIADAQAREANEAMLAKVNARREELGKTLIEASDPRNIIADAEAAGFNPVTWLGAGYGTRMSAFSDGLKMMIPEYALAQASQVPQQHSMLSAIGAGLSSAGTAMGQQYRADQSYDLQMGKMDMAMDQFMMGLSSRNGLQSALSYGMGASAIAGRGTGAAGTLGLATGSGGKSANDEVYWPGYDNFAPQLWDAKKPEATNPISPAWNWKIPPGYANAEAWEDSFAELVAMPYGVIKFSDTVLYNSTGYTFRNAWDYMTGASKGSSAYTSGVQAYVPPGMPRSIAYPASATP